MLRRQIRAAFALSVIAVQPASAQRDGIVLVPFETDSATYGEVGQQVPFIEHDPEDWVIDLELPEGVVTVHSWEGSVVPFDQDFTPAYLLAALRRTSGTSMIEALPQRPSQIRRELATRAVELFPDHAFVPEFRAIECLELVPLDGKETAAEALGCATQFQEDFPTHERAADMAWLETRLEFRVYEFEGDVHTMMWQADGYEAFLDEHPDYHDHDRILARVAYLYYMAQESLPQDHEAVPVYRTRALELYDRLEESSVEAVRVEAIQLRFNLLHGRRVYGNPNAWIGAF